MTSTFSMMLPVSCTLCASENTENEVEKESFSTKKSENLKEAKQIKIIIMEKKSEKSSSALIEVVFHLFSVFYVIFQSPIDSKIVFSTISWIKFSAHTWT